MRPFGDKQKVNETIDFEIKERKENDETYLGDSEQDVISPEEQDARMKEIPIKEIKKLLEGFSIDDIMDILETVQADINISTKYDGNKNDK